MDGILVVITRGYMTEGITSTITRREGPPPEGGSSEPPPGQRAATVARRGRFDLAPVISGPPAQAPACSWRRQVVCYANPVHLITEYRTRGYVYLQL